MHGVASTITAETKTMIRSWQGIPQLKINCQRRLYGRDSFSALAAFISLLFLLLPPTFHHHSHPHTDQIRKNSPNISRHDGAITYSELLALVPPIDCYTVAGLILRRAITSSRLAPAMKGKLEQSSGLSET